MKKIKASTVTYVVFMLLFAVVVGRYLIVSYGNYLDLMAKEQELNQLIEQEKQKTVFLTGELEICKSDAYIEQMATEKLGYVKPNQVLYVNTAE